MEQQEPRKEFIHSLVNFLENNVRITPRFIEELAKHSNKEYIVEVNKLKNDMEKKLLIFLEFTRERSTCNEMSEILDRSGQTRAANLLRGYNSSPEFLEYTYEIALTVTPTVTPKSGGSKYFKMNGAPKGFCLIINNVRAELEKESYRFDNVFRQVGFDVDGKFDQTDQEIKQSFHELSKDERLKTHDALIIMIISHGRNEKIVCKDDTEIGMDEVVDYFSDINCPNLSDKPKMFFFNCCRTITNDGKFMHSVTNDRVWIRDNKYTMICNACQKGGKSWYIANQYTHFGQALSHCIAQYSCDKSVQSILNLTSERMKEHGVVEIRLSGITRELFLNPGFNVSE